MKNFAAVFSFLVGTFAVNSTALADAPQVTQTKSAAISLDNTEYFLRWSNGHQNEFTPGGQEDLDVWTDMITVFVYPDANTGEELALVANQVLGSYENNGTIIRTASVPVTPSKPAEHYIAALLGNDKLVESVQARFVLVNGIGVGIIYSHRVYGSDPNAEMIAWAKQNSVNLETKLMSADAAAMLRAAKK